ncbi:MAG TPA: phosphoribosyl-AMP cyclohydrolase [Clostridia bacterium]|nr:phosphoribosyl-AMP cyclohydrolase [Clostridia bacterium]
MANILELVKYNAAGLVPAVTQDIRTDEVLMLAWMNEESLRKTIETGKVHYFSRSRQKLWLKGETSGHFQTVRSISVDCDGDTLLIKVDQIGAACHTGHRSCFFTRLDADKLRESIDSTANSEETGNTDGITDAVIEESVGEALEPEEVSPLSGIREINRADTVENNGAPGNNEAGPEVLEEVFGVILDRKLHPKEGSYTNYLFNKGTDKILKKIGEEASEVIIASKNGSNGEISAEAADLMYHLMVLLADRGMSWNDIYRELNHRK